MATKSDYDLIRAIPKTYSVGAGGVVAGMPVMFGATDQEVVTATQGTLVIGVSSETAAQGTRVTVYILGVQIIPVKVGTGGATRGNTAMLVADGVSDNTGATASLGRFMQSGVVGDVVGMMAGGGT